MQIEIRNEVWHSLGQVVEEADRTTIDAAAIQLNREMAASLGLSISARRCRSHTAAINRIQSGTVASPSAGLAPLKGRR
jgi:hypothetical protein